MRLPRFRLRTLLIAVAIAAVCLWCETMWLISQAHRRTAEEFANRGVLDFFSGGLPDTPEEQAVMWKALGERAKRQQDYFDAMKAKYERLARYPWLPVEPDTPEPE